MSIHLTLETLFVLVFDYKIWELLLLKARNNHSKKRSYKNQKWGFHQIRDYFSFECWLSINKIKSKKSFNPEVDYLGYANTIFTFIFNYKSYFDARVQLHVGPYMKFLALTRQLLLVVLYVIRETFDIRKVGSRLRKTLSINSWLSYRVH